MNVAEALLKYLNDPGSGVKTKGSKANYASEIHKLPQDRKVDSFNEAELIEAAYTPLVKGPRKGQAPSDGTVYARRKCYEGFFSYCQWKGWLKDDPALHLKRRLGGRGQPIIENNWLTREEVAVVLDTVNMDEQSERRDDLVLRLGFTAGLRAAELGSLRWRDVNFDRREISLVGKGHKIAVISISPNTAVRMVAWQSECAAAISARPGDHAVLPPFQNRAAGIDPETGSWLPKRIKFADWPNSGIVPASISRVCQKYSGRSGIVFRPHDMRRTCCGLLKENGLDIYQVSKAMRHSDVSTTERYLQTRPDAAAQAVREAGLDF